MTDRFFQHRTNRLLVALMAATYVGVGVLGHGLHAWLPCVGTHCCDDPIAHGDAAEGHAGDCCHHHHGLAAYESAALEGGPRFSAPDEHDADNCTLCALLAKINVGYAEMSTPDDGVEPFFYVTARLSSRLPADLALFAAARGPPLA